MTHVLNFLKRVISHKIELGCVEVDQSKMTGAQLNTRLFVNVCLVNSEAHQCQIIRQQFSFDSNEGKLAELRN